MTRATEDVCGAAFENLGEAIRRAPPAAVSWPAIVPVAGPKGPVPRVAAWSRAGVSIGASVLGHVGVLVSMLIWGGKLDAVAVDPVSVESGKTAIELRASMAAEAAPEPDGEVEVALRAVEPLDRPEPARQPEPLFVPETYPEATLAESLPELPRVPSAEWQLLALAEVGVELCRAPAGARRVESPRVEAAEACLPKTETGLRRIRASAAESSLASVASQASQGADSSPPSPIYNPAPSYPREALAARQTGRVSVRVEVGPDGTVLAAAVHRSSGIASLDRAALEAVRRWRFPPDPSEPVRRLAVPIQFTIAEGP